MCLPHQIEELIRRKVDFVGFIFYPKSPRYALEHLSLEAIAQFKHEGKVGVFVNESVANLIEIATKANLNYVQLHGNESADYIETLHHALPHLKIIKTIAMSHQPEIVTSPFVEYYLLDTASKDHGGTGIHFNWEMIAHLNLNRPYLLSGGLQASDLEQIQNIYPRPMGLDVNSKFEKTPGLKDLKLIDHLLLQLKDNKNEFKTTQR